jgi:GNAT superfamily N-acetyltransferase
VCLSEICDRGRQLSDVVEAAACPVGRASAAAYDSAVGSWLAVRSAQVEDVAQMAHVNVRCWHETYRGLMSDAVLDDPGFLAARERFWTAALTDERYRENRAAVAQRDGEVIGIAMSGPPLDAAAAWTRQLYVLYVYAADHGTGAGRALLEAVIDAAADGLGDLVEFLEALKLALARRVSLSCGARTGSIARVNVRGRAAPR